MKIVFTIEVKLKSDVELNQVLNALDELKERAEKYVSSGWMAVESVEGKASVEMP